MALPKIYARHIAMPANTSGVDYVVGDLHGCYALLMSLLTHVKFDIERDRLFSVGDMIDRGPDSLKCGELIYMEWFHAVRGNHEQMMIDAISGLFPGSEGMWVTNGGLWYEECDATAIADLASAFDLLPYVISVGQGADRFNIVHAELLTGFSSTPDPVTDQMIDTWEFDNYSDSITEQMLWGRTMISSHTYKKSVDQTLPTWHHPSDLSVTFVGHTPVRIPVKVQSQIYLDGGACFHYMGSGNSEQNTLRLACPSKKELYIAVPLHQTISTVPFDQISEIK